MSESADDVFIHATEFRPVSDFKRLEVDTEIEIEKLEPGSKGFKAVGITLV